VQAEEKSILRSTLQWFLTPRGIGAVAFWLTMGFLVLMMTDLFDTPAEKAGSDVRKCVRARQINMMADAERYCARAMHLVETEKGMPDIVIGRANSATASLAMVQKRTEESVRHCKAALPAWRRVENYHDRDEREENIRACENVIAAAEAAARKGADQKVSPAPR